MASIDIGNTKHPPQLRFQLCHKIMDCLIFFHTSGMPCIAMHTDHALRTKTFGKGNKRLQRGICLRHNKISISFFFRQISKIKQYPGYYTFSGKYAAIFSCPTCTSSACKPYAFRRSCVFCKASSCTSQAKTK